MSFRDRLRDRTGPQPNYTSDPLDEDDFILEEDDAEGVESDEEVFRLGEIDKILDRGMRPTASNDPDSDNGEPSQVIVNQYLVKWKGLSYLHCSWVPEQEFEMAYKSHPRFKLKSRLKKFNDTMDNIISSDNGDEFVAIRPEWTTVDRVIACRGEDDAKEYLVKYKELSYEESYWEAESNIQMFQNQIQRFKDINSGSRRDRYVENERRNQMEFEKFDHTPEFLTGSLHEYQLEGLNFLRYSWFKGTRVILADEMGLGKTIQSIAFLASLFEENVAPHLVVAPLSTLTNWEREFATWTPHMNVVMYIGSSEARHVIREHEFYFPKGNKIKFDVLLTSYEMINFDTAVLKPIKWNCLIVDEGHRLKNSKSKLYSSLNQFKSKHRVLLTGTPLQNNLDELFVLMHFLEEEKFRSLEEFQEEFKEINQEEQISNLHKILAPHLLRRVKKDVLKDKLPPKKELILRVDLSSLQKELYRAIITNNYQVLAKRGGAKIRNVLMELRKVCSHPYLLEGIEPRFEDAINEANKQLLEASGKLQLLDKMMVKLKEQGHKVLLYSQFQRTLDLLEYYCRAKNWFYERIDGKVGGAERQVRIDRFNAENSNRFCFLLSTRAGGLGINLATADTVIIYDSDWNPHADLQAMARAHRLGQTNKVMIYRLIHRGTVEERMMEMTKKKMLLEHLVVGKMQKADLSQDELDDIIKYGSKELFSEENDEAGKSGKIHYDDAAIEKLLDRDHVDAEEVLHDDEEENGFLKAFKVANFEYIDEIENEAEEAQGTAAATEKAQAVNNNADRRSYWQELLKDKFEVHQAEELNALGKRKRNCKQISLEEEDDDDDDDGLEVTLDESYEAEPTNVEAARQGNPVVKRRTRKRARDNSGPIPLMEGEGKSLRVLGFNQKERTTFFTTFMRYGHYDWKVFLHSFKKKTYDEIKAYGMNFLKYLSENSRESSLTYLAGDRNVVGDVHRRIGDLMLFREKCKFLEDNPTEPCFPDRIKRIFVKRTITFWTNDEYDKILIRAVFRLGYGSWQSIVDDKEFEPIREPLCNYLKKLTGEAANIQSKLCQQVRRRVAELVKLMEYEYTEKMRAEQPEAETKVMDTVGTSFEAADGLPKNDSITSEETSAAAVDNKQHRVEVAQLYNQTVNGNSRESVPTYLNIQPLRTLRMRENRNLRAGVGHDVEMNYSFQASTSGSSNVVDRSMMEEEEKAAEDVDVKVIEVIVLD